MLHLDPLRDVQQIPSVGTCTRCGCELYGDEEGICYACEAELREYDPDTVNAVMECYDRELRKYLADDLRDTVWNAVSNQFPEG